MKLDIQLFADGKVVIDTELNRKNFENGLSKMQSSTQKAGSTIKNIVVGLGITKIISTAMNQITSSIDSAISRYDTLNQFPKVMSNLGIGAEDAQKSIDKMSDKLSGLPTTLDQGARAVQRFTSKNSDVAKSTDLFLALNNAILAGGASSEIQSSALEQLSQAYAKGKPDMMEWRTAMTAMPAQLKQVAQAMGYVDADALGEALREGSVSMDEFMDTITKLNTEGVDGFKSFEEQARNSTGGLETSITVAKTQVVKGVTDMIDAINEKLQDLGLGSLSEIIGNMGKKVKEVLDSIAKLIKGEISINDFITAGVNSITGYINGLASKLPDIMRTITDIFKQVVDAIIQNLPTIIESAKTLITNFIIGLKENLPTLVNSAVDLLTSLADAFVDNIDFIIDAGIELIMALIDGILIALPRLIEKAPEIMAKMQIALIRNLPKLIEAIFEILVKIFQTSFEMVKGIIDNALGDVTDDIINFFSTLPEKIKEIITKIIEFIKELPENLGFMLGYIAGKIYLFVTQTIPEFVNNAIEFIKSLPKKIWDILVEVINNVIKWFNDLKPKAEQGSKNIINAIINWFKQLPNNIKNVGVNIVQGLWNGINGMKEWIIEKVKSFGNSIVKGIKSALGIKSPSRVMRDEVGKYLAQGIGVGFEDELDNVYRAMQHSINLEQAKLQANVETGSVFNALQNTTPIEINLDASVDMDGQKVGRIVTPTVMRTVKNGGGV